MQLRALKRNEYKVLHSIMVESDFPDVPEQYGEALHSLDDCACYGKFNEKGQLMAAFIFGDMTADCAFIDVVCAPKFQKKWLSKNTLKWLFDLMFNQFNFEYIWLNPRTESSLNLAVNLGAKSVHMPDAETLTFVFTKYQTNKFKSK